jgi:multidrug efflux system outer membrane protein
LLQLSRVLARMVRSPAITLAAGLLSGCTLDWNKPDMTVDTPSAFRAAAPRPAPPLGGALDFAAKFGSKELTALVGEALSENFDIGAAIARIDQADAQARISSSVLWPTFKMVDTALRAQTPGAKSQGITDSSNSGSTTQSGGSTANTASLGAQRSNSFQAGITASYEIDFWGKNRDVSMSSRLLANASRFDRDVVEISSVSSVLNAYFQVLAAQDRLRIAQQNIQIAETVWKAIKARVEAGTASVLDYSQQESVLAIQRASVPPLEQTVRQTKNTLAVLIGHTPESIDIKGGSLTRLHFPDVQPGLPSELLLRRPDIAEAEEKLASQEFSVRQARAAFFPSIQLTGQYGIQSIALKSLFRPEAIAWQIAGTLTQPLFDGYNLQGQFMLAQGRYAELAELYRKQIITALSDTENALIAVRETGRQLKLQGEAVAAARRAYHAAEGRLREGTIDIVTLSTTETTLFQNEDILAQVRLAHFQAATSLYQALGGGWHGNTRLMEINEASVAFEADKGPWP